MTDIAGKTILITGAANGIGRLMALEMARYGVRLVLWDVESDPLSEVANQVERLGSSAFPFECDLLYREQISETASAVREEVGDIDILVNNAGVVTGKYFLECSESELEKTFRINALAPVWTVKAFLPGMLEKDSGHIVNISSAAGLVATTKMADYAASKFALFGFDEALRVEFKKLKYPIRTTVVCPYYIGTEMFAGVKTRFPLLLPILSPEKVVRRIVQAIQKDKARLYMPPIVYLIPLVRLLPVPAFDLIMRTLGVHNTMDEFRGKRKMHP